MLLCINIVILYLLYIVFYLFVFQSIQTSEPSVAPQTTECKRRYERNPERNKEKNEKEKFYQDILQTDSEWLKCI